MPLEKSFLCYSRVDSDFVLQLAKDMRVAGANVWLDQLDLVGGDIWDNEIEKALENAETMIFVISTASIASKNCMDEVSLVLEENKRVIPILLEKCKIPFRLKRVQHIDFTGNYETGFNNLLKAFNLKATPAPLEENEETFWKIATKSNSVESYQKYLNEYPSGKYKQKALIALDNIKKEEELKQKEEKEEILWSKAVRDNSISSFKIYLEETELAKHDEEAKNIIKKLEDEVDRPAVEQFWEAYPTYMGQALMLMLSQDEANLKLTINQLQLISNEAKSISNDEIEISVIDYMVSMVTFFESLLRSTRFANQGRFETAANKYAKLRQICSSSVKNLNELYNKANTDHQDVINFLILYFKVYGGWMRAYEMHCNAESVGYQGKTKQYASMLKETVQQFRDTVQLIPAGSPNEIVQIGMMCSTIADQLEIRAETFEKIDSSNR